MLSPAHRRSIHSSFVPLLGPEEADALMSELPASPHDEPVTRSDLAAFRADVDTAFATQRTELHTGLADLRADNAELNAELRTDLNTGLAELRTEVHDDIAELRTDQAALRAELHDLFRQMAMWVAVAIITAMIGGMGLAAGVGAAVTHALGA